MAFRELCLNILWDGWFCWNFFPLSHLLNDWKDALLSSAGFFCNHCLPEVASTLTNGARWIPACKGHLLGTESSKGPWWTVAIIKAKLEKGQEGNGQKGPKTQEGGILLKSLVCVCVCVLACACYFCLPFLSQPSNSTNCSIRKKHNKFRILRPLFVISRSLIFFLNSSAWTITSICLQCTGLVYKDTGHRNSAPGKSLILINRETLQIFQSQ